MVGKHCNACQAKFSAFARETASSATMVKLPEFFLHCGGRKHSKTNVSLQAIVICSAKRLAIFKSAF